MGTSPSDQSRVSALTGGAVDLARQRRALFKVAGLAEIPVKDFDRVIRALNRGRRAA